MPKSLKSKIEKSRVRRKSYCMDLRIQSPSSLGYMHIEGIDTAPALIRLAKVKGLDIISVTDFFNARFLDELKEAASGTKIRVLPGIMIRCAIKECDDIILACFFPEDFSSEEIFNLVSKQLGVPAHAFGRSDYIIKKDFQEVIRIIESSGGILVPSRMDKTPYRRDAIKALVERFGFRAFDLAYFEESSNFIKKQWPEVDFQLFSFSNATALAQVGSRNSTVLMANPGFKGLAPLVERAF